MITFFWNGCPWSKATFHHKPAKDSSGEVCADQGVVRGMECEGDTDRGRLHCCSLAALSSPEVGLLDEVGGGVVGG